MWKWTNPEAIQVIILDADSLDETYLEFEYGQYIKDVKVYFVKLNSSDPDVLSYFEVTSLLQDILRSSKCESTSMIAISNNPFFLKEMIQNHIGTISTNDLKKEYLKYTPDFTKCTLNLLPEILKNERKGYCAEVCATYGKAIEKLSLLNCRTELFLDKESKTVNIYFGGRYYSDKHKYLSDDPLSTVVLKFKNQYMKEVDLFFDLAIQFIRKQEEIDFVTYIPLKPKDFTEKRFDRFASLKLERNKKDGVHLQNILKCESDFSQKGNGLIMRKEIIKGVFCVLEDVKGKTVIILDDVYATGSTMTEAIETLYKAGAKKVIAIVLAVNQMVESTLKYQSIQCPYCRHPMKIKLNQRSGELFFGCKNYYEHSNRTTTINLIEGLLELKQLNKLEVLDMIDLNDEY